MSLVTKTRRFSPLFPWVVAVLLALTHVVLAITATTGKCVAFDEIAHIVAGQSYWEHRDFRLHPENGMLPQRLAGLPSRFTRWFLPTADDPAWARADIWRLANATFYELGNNTDFQLLLARCVVSVHAFGIVLLVFGWSRRLFGLAGAFTSTIVCCLSPTLLAHGPLATSDAAMAFWLLAATGAYWRFLAGPSLPTAAISSICLGFAAVAKFSAVLLAPIWLIMWLGHSLVDPECTGNGGTRDRVRRATNLFSATVLLVVGAIAVVWHFYEWRQSAFGPSLPAGTYFRPWPEVLRNLGSKAGLFSLIQQAHILPDAYVYGLANVVAYSQARGAFLNGAFSTSGWVEFFPYAFLVKTSLPVLVTLCVSATVLLRTLADDLHGRSRQLDNRIPRLWSLFPLVTLSAVYWAASLSTHLNIGHRHLLPIYPVLFILCGAAGQWAFERKLPGIASIAALMLWCAAASFGIRPHYLAYFNAFAGGPKSGYHHLVESSIDWGMELPQLSAWLHDNVAPNELIYLSYFGMGHPAYEGINATPLPSLPLQETPRPTALRSGTYAISATMLQQPYSAFAGPWTADRERRYQELRQLEALAGDWDNGVDGRRTQEKAYYSDPTMVRIWAEYDNLRFARLCHYLRTRTPDARVGYSILIFRLAQSELDAALHGSVSELVKLIEAQGRLSE